MTLVQLHKENKAGEGRI